MLGPSLLLGQVSPRRGLPSTIVLDLFHSPRIILPAIVSPLPLPLSHHCFLMIFPAATGCYLPYLRCCPDSTDQSGDPCDAICRCTSLQLPNTKLTSLHLHTALYTSLQLGALSLVGGREQSGFAILSRSPQIDSWIVCRVFTVLWRSPWPSPLG